MKQSSYTHALTNNAIQMIKRVHLRIGNLLESKTVSTVNPLTCREHSHPSAWDLLKPLALTPRNLPLPPAHFPTG